MPTYPPHGPSRGDGTHRHPWITHTGFPSTVVVRGHPQPRRRGRDHVAVVDRGAPGGDLQAVVLVEGRDWKWKPSGVECARQTSTDEAGDS